MYNMLNNALNPTMLGLKKYHNGQCNRSNNNEKKYTMQKNFQIRNGDSAKILSFDSEVCV